jgi:adenosylcobyric acid synthase
LSNATDVDALACEPGVQVTMTTDAMVLRSADLLVLPGTRSTVADLHWLRSTGLASAVAEAAHRGVPVLGICGGYQMLARTIDDPIESGFGRVDGLDLLPISIRFGADKVLRRTVGRWAGQDVAGYEIHHGVADVRPGSDAEVFLDGCRSGSVWGTMWHGAFESDGFRRAWLAAATADLPRPFTPAAGTVGFAGRRELMINRLANAIADSLDTTALLRLLETPAG